MNITREYLRAHPDHVFVFGDNLLRQGKGGAAALRDEPNTYGFITKKFPSNNDGSFYRPVDYMVIFQEEMLRLMAEIEAHPEKIYLISKLGAGLANKYLIWERIIEVNIQALRCYPNVKFLWEDEDDA